MIKIKKLTKIIKSTPNDADLGAKIRKVVNDAFNECKSLSNDEELGAHIRQTLG